MTAIIKKKVSGAVVVAQLVERSLPIPEVRSSQVIGKKLFMYWTFVYCQLCIMPQGLAATISSTFEGPLSMIFNLATLWCHRSCVAAVLASQVPAAAGPFQSFLPLSLFCIFWSSFFVRIIWLQCDPWRKTFHLRNEALKAAAAAAEWLLKKVLQKLLFEAENTTKMLRNECCSGDDTRRQLTFDV